MKRASIDLNGMKSRCFVLLACLSLVVATTSCSNDEFETNFPEEQKQYTKAELIEQALSRMPQTRANGNFPIVMVNEGKTISMMVKLHEGEQMTIHWGNGEVTPISGFEIQGCTYDDDEPSHVIFFEGGHSALEELWVDNNELIFLDVARNQGLKHLSCSNNRLDTLDLTGCGALQELITSVNNLSSIDLSHLQRLEHLLLDYNDLTSLDISNHLELQTLNIGNNTKLKKLNLSNLPKLTGLYLHELSIETFNDLPVDDSNFSFADFPLLNELEVGRTTFITSLNISNNPYLELLNMEDSKIKRLDISNGAITYLFAQRSSLTNLVYTPDKILNLYDLRITGTPFERSGSSLYSFLTSGLPDRSSLEEPGKLYITQSMITPLIPYLEKKNWVIK